MSALALGNAHKVLAVDANPTQINMLYLKTDLVKHLPSSEECVKAFAPAPAGPKFLRFVSTNLPLLAEMLKSLARQSPLTKQSNSETRWSVTLFETYSLVNLETCSRSVISHLDSALLHHFFQRRLFLVCASSTLRRTSSKRARSLQ